jgi:hypothetical protein
MEEMKLSFDLGAMERRPSDLETIKDGTSYYRILPPFGKNNRGALWSQYMIHWGFEDASGNKVPVTCSYLTEKFCPICTKVRDAEEKRKGFAKGTSEYDQLDAFIRTYSVDNGYYLNAVTQEGLVKKLKLKPSAVFGRRAKNGEAANPNVLFSKIKEAINSFQVDPVSLDAGVWFAFTKAGQMFDTTYSVDFRRTSSKVNGRITQEIDTTPLTEQFPELYQQLKEQYASGESGPAFDVHSLYKPMSSLDLKKIIETGVAPSNRKEQRTLEVGPLTEAPVAFVPKQEAAPAATQTELVAAVPAAAVTVAPVQTPPSEPPAEKAETLNNARANLMALLRS